MVLMKLDRSNEHSLSTSTSSLNSIDASGSGPSGSGGGLSSNATKDYNEKTVYLGDLDIETTEKQIQFYFDSTKVPTLKVVKQPHSSYAHVTFQTADMAKRFLDLAIIRLSGRVIRVMPFNQPNHFDPEANLIIKNLEAYLNESDIINKFREYGEILSCKLVRDDKGESKCYAYLQYKERASATHAIDNLNNTYWDERCDPDFKYRKFQEKLFSGKRSNMAAVSVIGKLNESDLEEMQLFNDYFNKMGKKIYVGIFKKRNEYSKIKSEKEGKLSNLYVKNFGANFGDRDLFNLFKTYGSIKSAKVRRLKVGLVEKPLGCGFVDFENPDEAEKARQALDGYVLASSGRKISVTYADCKSRRLRKKLEAAETNMYHHHHSHHHHQQQQHHQLVNVNDGEQFESTPQVFYENNNNTNEDGSDGCDNDVQGDDEDNDGDDLSSEEERERKISMSSMSSHNSFSSTVSSDAWLNTWSRLLNTSDWIEYRLF